MGGQEGSEQRYVRGRVGGGDVEELAEHFLFVLVIRVLAMELAESEDGLYSDGDLLVARSVEQRQSDGRVHVLAGEKGSRKSEGQLGLVSWASKHGWANSLESGHPRK